MDAQQYRALVARLESIQEGPVSVVANGVANALSPKAPNAPATNPSAATMQSHSALRPNPPPLIDLFNQMTQMSDDEKANVVDALWKAYNSQSGRMGTKSLPPTAQKIIDQLTQPTAPPPR